MSEELDALFYHYTFAFQWATKGSQCCSEKKKSLREMGSLTIHDAQILERGIVEPLNDPPDYGRIRDDFDQEQFMPAMAYMKNPPMAISVSLDQALAEQVGNHPSAKLIGPTAPLRGRDLLVSNPSLDRSYANLKRPDQRDMKNPKKGNDYYDYV